MPGTKGGRSVVVDESNDARLIVKVVDLMMHFVLFTSFLDFEISCFSVFEFSCCSVKMRERKDFRLRHPRKEENLL